jgi:hypothetical protein
MTKEARRLQDELVQELRADIARVARDIAETRDAAERIRHSTEAQDAARESAEKAVREELARFEAALMAQLDQIIDDEIQAALALESAMATAAAAAPQSAPAASSLQQRQHVPLKPATTTPPAPPALKPHPIRDASVAEVVAKEVAAFRRECVEQTPADHEDTREALLATVGRAGANTAKVGAAAVRRVEATVDELRRDALRDAAVLHQEVLARLMRGSAAMFDAVMESVAPGVAAEVLGRMDDQQHLLAMKHPAKEMARDELRHLTGKIG